MSEYKAGDVVRLTYEGPLTSGDALSLNNPEAYHTFAFPASKLTTEIVKRVDGPENDPIGTVRVDPRSRLPHVKVSPDTWTRLATFESGGSWEFSDSDMRDTEVIGTVPGTPAAETAKPKLRAFKDCDGEPWFELSPNSFTIGSTREAAATIEGYYSNWTHDELAGKFGPLTAIDE